MPAREFIHCSDAAHTRHATRGFHPCFCCNAVQIALRFSLRTSQATCGRRCRKILGMTNRMALSLAQVDPEVAAAVDHETLRQHEGLEMIASENFVSEAVLEAAGSVFTNKYAEGYPGRRYYGGCEYADVVENLARDRAKQIFGAAHANVQPHSGSQANAAAYMAVLQTGDTILGLDLAHGGHLTHGHKLSFSGKLYRTTFIRCGGIRADRLRRAGSDCRARKAEGVDRRGQRVSAAVGFCADAADRGQGGSHLYF
jgi:hypothetical protein